MYVNNILTISCEAHSTLVEIQGKFKFKNGKIEAPEFYFDAKLQKKPINGI